MRTFSRSSGAKRPPEEDVAVKLGMEPEAVHRYKQITGVAELFKNSEYSMAWEMEGLKSSDPVP